MNIYLSNPSLICCAGNCPSDFFYSITTKNQEGIKKTKCSLCNNSDISDNANKEFFVGKIDDDIVAALFEQQKKQLEILGNQGNPEGLLLNLDR